MSLLFRRYRDGVRVWRWGLRLRRRRLRGVAVGVEWTPGPWPDAPRTHSRVTVFLAVAALTVAHVSTVAPGHRPDAGDPR